MLKNNTTLSYNLLLRNILIPIYAPQNFLMSVGMTIIVSIIRWNTSDNFFDISLAGLMLVLSLIIFPFIAVGLLNILVDKLIIDEKICRLIFTSLISNGVLTRSDLVVYLVTFKVYDNNELVTYESYKCHQLPEYTSYLVDSGNKLLTLVPDCYEITLSEYVDRFKDFTSEKIISKHEGGLINVHN